MIAATRGESDTLLRLLDLVRLSGVGTPTDGRVAAALRRLVTDTASASAVERAQVRAAVHLSLLRRERGARRVNEILSALGRSDLIVDTA